jgi:60 kDa SS-A/Ro ribonucleoprotein
MFNVHVQKPSNKIPTYEGGTAVTRPKELELTLNVLGSFMSTDMFYETVDQRISKIQELTKTVSPAYVDKLAQVARNEFNLRTPPAVLMAIKTLNGQEITAEVSNDVFSRGDEITEYLSAVKSLSEKKIFVNKAKKVAANTLANLTERKALRYMGGSKVMSLADAIRVSHPVPRDAKQSALFKFVSLTEKEGTLTKAWEKLTDVERGNLPLVAKAVSGEDTGEISWERAKSAGQSDWTVLVKTMGYMAILRNLRNFLQDVPVSATDFWSTVTSKLADKTEVANSKQLPFRFYSAYKAIRGIGDTRLRNQLLNALTTALDYSAYNLPRLEGRTLVAVDTSGSMEGTAVSSRGNAKTDVDPMSYREIGAVLGSAMALAQNATLVTWADTARVKPLGRSVMDTVESYRSGEVGHGTDPNTISRAVRIEDYDNIIIFTDGQFHRNFNVPAGFKGKIYFVDLSGYVPGFADTNKSNVVTIGGWSDATLKLIAMNSKGGITEFVRNYSKDNSGNI